MKLHVTRIKEGEDLKQAITEFVAERKLKSGIIVSAVGSLGRAKLRMSGAQPNHQDIRQYDGPFEIVSFTGTIASDGGAHFHISISDKEGQVFDGHVKEGCIVHTTVELTIS